MKKSLLAFTLTAAALTAPFVGAPTSASANDSIATATFTDGVLNINYPSKYAGRTVSVEDGHFGYGSVTLNSNGDATKDFKTGANFRYEAPDRVYLVFEGFANPVARATNLAKEIGEYRLMFKQNYNATQDFEIKPHTLPGFFHPSYADVSLEQTSSVKRVGYANAEAIDGDYFKLHVFMPVSTDATFSGTSYPVKPVIRFAEASGLSGERTADFLFDDKQYPGIVLR